jgi:hypothetical protein
MNTQDTYHIAHLRHHDQQTLVCHLTEALALASKDLPIRTHHLLLQGLVTICLIEPK